MPDSLSRGSTADDRERMLAAFQPHVDREALRTLIGWARGDHICKRCSGTGELGDDPDDFIECPACAGEGEVEIA